MPVKTKIHYGLISVVDENPVKDSETNTFSKCVKHGLMIENQHILAHHITEDNAAESAKSLRNLKVIELKIEYMVRDDE